MTNRISMVERRFSVEIRKLKWNFECQHSVVGANLNVKIGLRSQSAIFSLNSNVKIGFLLSKCVIPPEFECQNRISNITLRYSAPVRISKHDFECQNAIFGPN